ncbi:MAG: tRNA (adenosine(37)-N6)-dimethylallyltransferase MiaA [Sedimentisphaerales bacterium]|nr:tRNA (adenosine(37)-N6)-dimethylallyltransferase MiaA [Sedimentisphaerales bacterium]
MILILGVTGSGKGRLAFDLARDLGAEIISIDSMKVYRRMDIGTAKPPKEARAQVKHHLIDIIEPSDSFSVRSFLDNALEAIKQIKAGNKPVVAVGGTSLYIKALLYGLFEGPAADKQIRAELRAHAETQGLDQLYRQLTQVDPEAAARIHQNDARRIIRALEVYELTGKPISSFQRQWNPQQTSDERRATDYDWTIIGLRRDKAEENKTINARVKKMIAAGLVDEVKSLLSEEKPLSPQARCAIGYAEVTDHLSGKTTLDDAIELIKKNTRRLAKSQRTWFKTFRSVHWLNIGPEEPGEKILDRVKGTADSIGSR